MGLAQGQQLSRQSDQDLNLDLMDVASDGPE